MQKIRVFVKCLYNESLMIFLLNLNVLVVCTSDVKIHQQMAASRTANGMLAMSICLDWSTLG